jgi:hypothetical protein
MEEQIILSSEDKEAVGICEGELEQVLRITNVSPASISILTTSTEGQVFGHGSTLIRIERNSLKVDGVDDVGLGLGLGWGIAWQRW